MELFPKFHHRTVKNTIEHSFNNTTLDIQVKVSVIRL